ncbi:LGFP repeat-containing protein [Mycobacteroides abscessus subsp. abscessus]|nr:LGFP repeat-containing protein [Mycobacteroides abscessus subsp. abscessus]
MAEAGPPVDAPPAEDTVAAGPASGRHHALGAEEPETAQMSFRVATGAEPPEGYDIKANTESGLYWVPGSPGYDDAPVQIWFASEEFAVTNGFIRG